MLILKHGTPIKKSLHWLFNPKASVKYYGEHKMTTHDIEYGQTFDIGSVSFLPLEQRHGSINSTGFRIGDFAYSTDLNSMPEESWEALEGLDTWVLECDSFTPTRHHNHMDQALAWIERLKPKQAFLTHFDISMDHEQVSKSLPEGVKVAYDGMVLKL